MERSVCQHRRYLLGPDEGGGDDVHIDSVRCPLGRQLPAQSNQAAFSCTVSRISASTQGEKRAHRAKVHLFTAVSLPNHMARRCLCLEHGALEVDVVDVVEHRFCDFFCLFLAVQTDAVHENIQTAEVVGGFVYHPLRFRDRNSFERSCPCIVAFCLQRFGESSGTCTLVAADGNLRSRRCQASAHRFPDTPVATCDQGHLAIESKKLFYSDHG